MQTMFLKKIPLTDQEVSTLQKELLHYGKQEESYENELEAVKDHYKSAVDSKKADITSAKTKRKEIQTTLSNGYRMLEVDSKKFTDGDLRKEFVIEVGTRELLEVKDLPSYAKLELGFASYTVVLCDRDKFIELYKLSIDIFSTVPMCIDDVNMIYVFEHKQSMRVVRLAEDFTYEEFIDVVLNPPFEISDTGEVVEDPGSDRDEYEGDEDYVDSDDDDNYSDQNDEGEFVLPDDEAQPNYRG